MIILENATLAQLTDGHLLPGHHVAIDGEVIVEVSERPIKAANADRIDLAGRCLLPGLIDAHFHAALTEMNPANSRDLPPTLMTARAAILLRKALMRGFTTVRDMAGADWGMRTATAEGSILGPRLYIAGRALSQTGGHGDLRRRTDEEFPCSCSNALACMSVVADGAIAAQVAAREQLRQGVDHLKVFVSGGVVSPSDPLHSLQYTDHELSAVVNEARNWGTYVAAHAYTPGSIMRAVSAGVRTIEHGNLLDAPTAAAMATHKAFLVPTLVTYDAMHSKGSSIGLSSFSLEKLSAAFAAGFRSIELALSAGVSVGLGTDLLGELHEHQSRELLLRAKVQKPHEVLRSATEVNALILGLPDKLGAIRAGAYADLIALKGDPMRDLGLLQDQGAHLDLIMKAGAVVKRAL
jgi:imidazolonepropionase-like amidohydrolase